MDFRKKFMVEPGGKVRLSKIDPSYTGEHETHEKALPEITKHVERMQKLQYLLYADGSQSVLVVLQALDAAGKDGTVRHVFSGMNPQGVAVFGFKQPSKEELAHDFLWLPYKSRLREESDRRARPRRELRLPRIRLPPHP
jgi:polyphosphate kinase 2 (PPK2 family)